MAEKQAPELTTQEGGNIVQALLHGYQPDTPGFYRALGLAADQNALTPPHAMTPWQRFYKNLVGLSGDEADLHRRQVQADQIALALLPRIADHLAKRADQQMNAVNPSDLLWPGQPAQPGQPEQIPPVPNLQMPSGPVSSIVPVRPPMQMPSTLAASGFGPQFDRGAPALESPISVPRIQVQPQPLPEALGTTGSIQAPTPAVEPIAATPPTLKSAADWLSGMAVRGEVLTEEKARAYKELSAGLHPAHTLIPSETLAKMYPEISKDEWNAVTAWPQEMVTHKLSLYKQETALDAKADRLDEYATLRRDMADRIDGRQASLIALRKDLQARRLDVQEMNKGLSPQGTTILNRYLTATPDDLTRMKTDGSLDQLQAEMKGISAKVQSNAAGLRQEGFDLRYGKDVREQVSKVQAEARAIATQVDPKTGIQTVDVVKMGDYVEHVAESSKLLHPSAKEELLNHAHYLKQGWIPTKGVPAVTAPAASMPAPTRPPKPTYKDYPNLPSGTVFTDPDGKERRKP